MTDFQTLLKESIIARGIRDPAKRQAVYAQARSALIRQLAEVQPRIAEGDIAKRVVEFDQAMTAIEVELAVEWSEAPRVADDPEEIAHRHDDAAEGGSDHHRLGDDPTLEPDLPPPPTRPRPGAGSRGAVAVRRATGPAVYTDEDDMLPAPVPYPGQWREEEAVLEDDGAPAPRPLPPPARPRLPPPQRRLGWTLSEGDKIKVLGGAIGALGLVFIGLLIYLFLPGRDAGVTIPLNQGVVSDAAAANRIATATLDVKQSFVLFDGRDPTIFQASSDNPVRLDSDAGGAFARIGTSTASSGVKVQIGPGLAARLAGQNVRVVIDVRAAPERGALNMRFAYQSGVALSHWQTANLAPGYARSGMTWIVPQMRTSATGADYLIIEPGIPGDGTYADIRSIRIDLLNAAPTT